MFNVYEGGILCKVCSGTFEENMKIDITTIKLMEYILSNDILRCSKAKVSKYITYELQRILKQYLMIYVDDINFKSLHLLHELENNNGVDKGEQ